MPGNSCLASSKPRRGLPLYHEVFDGNTAEVTTLKPTIEKLVSRFAVKRMIVVADRGLLSRDNLAELQAITLPCGTPLEFILAVAGPPLRRGGRGGGTAACRAVYPSQGRNAGRNPLE